MHGDAATHPDPEQLVAFGLGKLDDSETVAVAEHLETCESCRRTVEEAPSDTFLNALQVARPEPEPALPPELANHPRYRIVRELARGGMGIVYLAEQRLMEWPVAIKVIRQALVENPEAMERFHREARAAAKLDHANIVRAYDAEQVGGLHLLVMEYVEGLSLAEVLQRSGPLPVAHACHYVRQAALALQHAFERGMVHRDLKPHNLMLLPETGVVKVLDFGLARLASERRPGKGLTAENAVMGTPEYMAPEQATDPRQADIRADIYSLGCTLYCLLTGRPPFDEPTAMQTILAHLNKEAIPLLANRSDVPAELSALVARMLAKDPARRYQTPGEVAEALAPFCEPCTMPAAAATALAGKELAVIAVARTEEKKERQRSGLRPVPHRAWPDRRRWRALGLMAAVGIVGLGIIVTVRTKDGTIRIESNDPKATVEVQVDGEKIRVAAVRQALNPVSQGPGEPATRPGPAAAREARRSITNSIGMKLVLIPAGEFMMGSPATEPIWLRREAPQHKVRITKPFYLGTYEVTQRQYEAVMQNNPSNFKHPENPVEQVLWGEAAEFCRRLSDLPEEKRSGRRYRLPTEAEWEYACRAGTPTPFCWGYSLSRQDANFNASDRTAGRDAGFIEGIGRTVKVGSYRPNAWGLYDMHGNVAEWASDWYDEEYYAKSPEEDPKGPATASRFRVLRGGSWYVGSACCRSAFRHPGDPSFRDSTVGFRVVLLAITARGDGGVVYLSDMSAFNVLVAEGRFATKGKLGYSAGNPQSSRILVNGKESPNGLSMYPLSHGYARVMYRLRNSACTFLASVALNDSAGGAGLPPGVGEIPTPLTFQVLGDGKVLWKSRPVAIARNVQECNVDVTGIDVLELRVACPGSGVNAQAVWLEPRVMLK